MMRGKDVQDINELKREGLSIHAISELTGLDRKTIRKYLLNPVGHPAYGPRMAAAESKLEPFKGYLEDRLKAGVWNARVLLRELRGRNYAGGYSILTDWLRPQRESARVVAVRRFETRPGKQAQVDWGHLGSHARRETASPMGVHHDPRLQPPDDGRSGHRHQARHPAADARVGI